MASLSFSGKDFSGDGEFVKPDPGTYPVTLKAARMYLNNEYQSEETMVQISLIWDTGLVAEKEDGTDVDLLIFDDWIRFSLNEKANLTKRLAALMGHGFNPETAKADLELADGVGSLDDLKHWREGRTDVLKFDVNGESIFGKEAIVTITHNDKGYVKVTNVSAPVKSPATGRVKAKNAAPAGAPV